jgi:acyl-CoA synthetase (AMP-forming)/AMP-acid ligase II
MDSCPQALALGPSWWDLVVRRARLSPEGVALEDERGRSVTFAQFATHAEQGAAGLAALGVRPGHVVSWQLPTTVEAVVLMAALSRLGVAQNPVIPILRRAEVGQIVAQLDTDWLIVPGTWRGFDYTALAADVTEGQPCQVLSCDQFEPGPTGLALPLGDPATLDPPVAPGDSIRWYYFSSGTTAAPKGARHTDASVSASSNVGVDQWRLTADDVLPIAFPVSHIGGIMTFTAMVRAGGRLVLMESFDPVESPLVMAERGATLLGSAVPFFLAYLGAQRRHGDEPLFPRLRNVMAGGAPVPPALALQIEEELGVRVINSWGLTEFPTVTSLAVDDPPEKFLGWVGRPASGVDVRVRGPDGTLQPSGMEGELCVRGPQCFAGYVDAALDADAFHPDGFFRTGDLGVVDAEGYVRVTGRLKDIIIRNAENISALEVEEALTSHPSIAEVAVVGLPDPRTGERACAVVVVVDGAPPLTLTDVAAHCRANGLATQKIPEQLEIVPTLPRNSMGKVLKQELRANLT